MREMPRPVFDGAGYRAPDPAHPAVDRIGNREVAGAGADQDRDQVPLAHAAKRPAQLLHKHGQFRHAEAAGNAHAGKRDDSSGIAGVLEEKRLAQARREWFPAGKTA